MDMYDREGKQLTIKEWGNLLEDWNYRSLAQTVNTWGNKTLTISTVWLGVSHGEDEEGRPLIYESAVELNGEWEVSARYATQEEAIDGHRVLCLKYGITYDPVPPVKQFHELRFDSKDRWKDLG